MSITKMKAARSHNESTMQQACVKWFRFKHNRLRMLLFAIPNGSRLAGNQKQRAIQGKRLKAEGLVAGVADLFLSVPSGQYHGLYLEAKTEKGRQQDSQKDFEESVLSAGYGYAIFRSEAEFISIVTTYLEEGYY